MKCEVQSSAAREEGWGGVGGRVEVITDGSGTGCGQAEEHRTAAPPPPFTPGSKLRSTASSFTPGFLLRPLQHDIYRLVPPPSLRRDSLPATSCHSGKNLLGRQLTQGNVSPDL